MRRLLLCDIGSRAVRKNTRKEEYEKRYDGLDQLFFDRDWLWRRFGMRVRPRSRFAIRKSGGYANAAANVFAQLI